MLVKKRCAGMQASKLASSHVSSSSFSEKGEELNLTQMPFQEIDRQRPGLCRRLLVAHAVVGIDKRVTGIVHFDRDILASLFIHALDLLHLLHRNTLVPLPIEGQHRRIDPGHFLRCGIVSSPIEGNDGS